jgi:hypothetical protein
LRGGVQPDGFSLPSDLPYGPAGFDRGAARCGVVLTNVSGPGSKKLSP